MDKIEELLTRGVANIYPSKEELEKVLRSGKKLQLYQGFDPTGTQLHIGHMVGLKKLRQWQDLDHKVIFLIGTGTGQAGDPSGKTTSREKFLSEEELRKNAKDYVMQAGKIVRFDGDNRVEIRYNSEWFNELNFSAMLTLVGHFSVQQLLERDLFQERMKQGEPINVRAFLYPIFQAYDSLRLEVDLEVGGTDQTFNMLCGRQLVKYAHGGKKGKFVMTTPLLTDSEGRKIGKTEGNVIAITDDPKDLFGKIMALPDEIISKGFEYLTDIPLSEIKKIEKAIAKGDNPVKYKKQLAFEITKDLNNIESAQNAQENFEKTVQKKELPEEITEVKIMSNEPIKLDQLIFESGLTTSKAEAKRIIEQGGVEVEGAKITNPTKLIELKSGMLIRSGKRKIIRLKINN